ncbi:NAD(P)-binding domain-containing protein, partial [Bacillus cereus]
MDKQIGFIGSGNMGMAMIGGMINKNRVSSNQIICS